MPDTFSDFRKQRFRWAYGAVQILRRHLGALSGHSPSRLTRGQRYHFLAGWLPWLTDSLNLVFTLAALCWSTAMALAPTRFDPPLIVLSAMPLTLFVFKMGKMFYLYRTRVGSTVAQTLASALAGLSLSHTISKAILLGFVNSRLPFFRTPKKARAHALMRALGEAREEGLIMLCLWLAGVAIVVRQGSDNLDLLVWVVVLLVQSIPYLAAVIMSLLSGLSPTGAMIISDITSVPPEVADLAEIDQAAARLR